MKKTFVFVFLLVFFFSFVRASARTTDKEALKIQREEFQSAVEKRRHSFFERVMNLFSNTKDAIERAQDEFLLLVRDLKKYEKEKLISE